MLNINYGKNQQLLNACGPLKEYAWLVDAVRKYQQEKIDLDAAVDAGHVKQGDLVVVTAGVPVGVPGTTNMIRVHLVCGSLLAGVGVGVGKASGPLCVCQTPEEIPAKFHPGCVLVVPYTSNDMLSYMRQAAAIISEESGANSHAATVGLTLEKPVIVGASGATSILKDGVLVSVDCSRGIVQRLPQ